MCQVASLRNNTHWQNNKKEAQYQFACCSVFSILWSLACLPERLLHESRNIYETEPPFTWRPYSLKRNGNDGNDLKLSRNENELNWYKTKTTCIRHRVNGFQSVTGPWRCQVHSAVFKSCWHHVNGVWQTSWQNYNYYNVILSRLSVL